MKKLYEPNFISRFLRIIEIYTSVALRNSDCFALVLKVSTPNELTSLIELLVYAQPRHGLIILKILENLIALGIPQELFEESIQRLLSAEGSVHKRLIDNTKTEIKFESKFIQFLFSYSLSIRKSMWSESRFESHGAYNVSIALNRILRLVFDRST